MTPLYFGDAKTRLFGAYHQPTGSSARETGVVLCYPFGQEYMRCHMAFRQLARQLAQVGIHVLRFDYFGTGDSAGNGEDPSIEQWTQDVSAAIEELKESAGISRVWLVGLRFGGLLAAIQASNRDDIEGVVMWDPVIDGAAYISELLPRDASARQTESNGGATIGVHGFPLTANLRRGLHQLNVLDLKEHRTQQSLIVVSEDKEDFRRLNGHLTKMGILTTYQVVKGVGDWEDVDRFGAALLPQQVIEVIVRHISGVGRA